MVIGGRLKKLSKDGSSRYSLFYLEWVLKNNKPEIGPICSYHLKKLTRDGTTSSSYTTGFWKTDQRWCHYSILHITNEFLENRPATNSRYLRNINFWKTWWRVSFEQHDQRWSHLVVHPNISFKKQTKEDVTSCSYHQWVLKNKQERRHYSCSFHAWV